MTETFNNIWDALIDDPIEKESIKIKSDLMIAIELYIKKNKLTQAQAAKLMQVTQPRISNLVNGVMDKFTIDSLVEMLARVGETVRVEVGEEQVTKSICSIFSFSETVKLETKKKSDDYNWSKNVETNISYSNLNTPESSYDIATAG